MKKKKATRRSKSKFASLEPQYNLKSRQELIDYDYIQKLSDKEKKWLAKFTEEYVNASLDEAHPRKNLHNSKRLRKDCYDRNNARNRDVLTKAKASGKFHYIDDVFKSEEDLSEVLEELLESRDDGSDQGPGFEEEES